MGRGDTGKGVAGSLRFVGEPFDPVPRAAQKRGSISEFAASLGPGTMVVWCVSIVISIASILWVGRVLFAEPLGLRPPDLRLNSAVPGLISLHGVIGAIALVIGPIQMSAHLRSTRPHLHRLLGRIYVGLVVVTAISSLGLAPKTDYLGLTYALPAGGLVCLTCMVVGVAAIYRHDVTAHERWMLRAYAALWISVSHRLYYKFLSDVFDPDFSPKYAFAFWLACATNLIVVEVVLPRRSARRRAVSNSPSGADTLEPQGLALGR